MASPGGASILLPRADPATILIGPNGSVGPVIPSPTIDCIDCGGTCHLISHPEETGEFYPGSVVVYRCEDCLDRWDVVLPDDEDAERGDGWEPAGF